MKGLNGPNARQLFLSAFKRLKSKQAVLNEYYQSQHWADLRRVKLWLEPNCEICGNPGHDVYHWEYKYLYDCKDTDVETLCSRCRDFKFREGLSASF